MKLATASMNGWPLRARTLRPLAVSGYAAAASVPAGRRQYNLTGGNVVLAQGNPAPPVHHCEFDTIGNPALEFPAVEVQSLQVPAALPTTSGDDEPAKAKTLPTGYEPSAY